MASGDNLDRQLADKAGEPTSEEIVAAFRRLADDPDSWKAVPHQNSAIEGVLEITPSMVPYIAARWVESGGLMSYGSVRSEVGHLLTNCLDNILRGAKPSDVPVPQIRNFELAINHRTAKALGLTIPPPLLRGRIR